ncbi:MAG TPA: 2Fe-2S iron-sulfur cluster-binding protein [Rhodoferax sp.]
MTSLNLLLWIVGAMVLQLAIYLAIGFWRHWQNFDALRASAIEGGQPATLNDDMVESEPVSAVWSGWRTFKVTHKVVENATGDICSFHLAPQDGQSLPAFMPGQYLTFRLDIPLPSGKTETITRCYSLSDGPRANGYRVSIKREPAPPNTAHPPGRSSNYFHDQVPLGGLLQVRPPAGHFHLDHSDAPLASKYQRPGRIDIDLLRRLLPLKPYHFYLCGPTPMLESLVSALEDWGVPDARIHFEAFGPASVKRKSAVAQSAAEAPAHPSDSAVSVNFVKSGKQVSWQPTSGNLLAFAEAQSIAVDSGCRAGSCGSCQTRIQHGEVSYREAPDFDPEPGTCLMCVCTPKTDVILEL